MRRSEKQLQFYGYIILARRSYKLKSSVEFWKGELESTDTTRENKI